MTSPPAVQNRQIWLRPIVCIACIAAASLVSVLALSAPAVRTLQLNLNCEALQLRSGLQARLRDDQTNRLNCITFYGYEASVRQLRQLRVTTDSGQPLPMKSTSALTIVSTPELPLDSSSMVLSPQGNVGSLQITLHDGSELRGGSSNDGQPMGFLVRSHQAQDTQVEIAMDGLHLEVNRLSLREIQNAGAGDDSDTDQLNIQGSGLPEMLQCSFLRPIPPNPSTAVETTFQFGAQTQRITLLPLRRGENRFHVAQGPVTASGWAKGTLRLGTEDLSVSGDDESIVIDPESLEIRELSLIPSDLPSKRTVIYLRASGRARQVSINGKNLVPTIIEDLMNNQSQKRGVSGLVIAACILAATVFLNRALTVLATLLMPSPKEK